MYRYGGRGNARQVGVAGGGPHVNYLSHCAHRHKYQNHILLWSSAHCCPARSADSTKHLQYFNMHIPSLHFLASRLQECISEQLLYTAESWGMVAEILYVEIKLVRSPIRHVFHVNLKVITAQFCIFNSSHRGEMTQIIVIKGFW